MSATIIENSEPNLYEAKGHARTRRPQETSASLTDSQLKDAKNIVQEFQEIFTDLPDSTDLVNNHIMLTSERPGRSKPYAVPVSVRQSLGKDIHDMLRMRVIIIRKSAYAAPVVIAKKPDINDRICADHRKLHQVTVFDPQPAIITVDLCFEG